MEVQPDDVVVLAYIGCVTVLVLVFHTRVEHAWLCILAHLLCVSIILVLIRSARCSPCFPWAHARNWQHVFWIPLAFRELHYLVHSINPKDIDSLLAKVDWSLFGGVYPTVWMENWMHPWLTEYLQITYSTFYFLPLSLGIVLWRDSNRGPFQNFLTTIVTAFYLSYLGYFAFPALGPRFEVHYPHQMELQGMWLTPWLRSCLDRLELVQRDAFPSGHTGVSLLVLYYVRRYRPKLFVIFLVVVLSLVFSTVYLRYHYVVDVLAGIILAILSLWVARLLEAWLEATQNRGNTIQHREMSSAV